MDFIALENNLAEADKNDCMKALAYVWMRLEYLEEQAELKRSGYVSN